MPPNLHLSRQFDAELEYLRAQVLQMGGLVEYQIRYAIEALRTHDRSLIEQVVTVETRVNATQCELDERCANMIARHGPTAFDLRFLLTAFKTMADLERVGDEAKKIALLARQLCLKEHARPGLPEIKLIAGEVIDMLRCALDGLARLDAEEMPKILHRDQDVDARFHSIWRALLARMIEDPRTISSSLDILFVAKALERIGDHAKNISEYVVYTVKGQDVRHAG